MLLFLPRQIPPTAEMWVRRGSLFGKNSLCKKGSFPFSHALPCICLRLCATHTHVSIPPLLLTYFLSTFAPAFRLWGAVLLQFGCSLSRLSLHLFARPPKLFSPTAKTRKMLFKWVTALLLRECSHAGKAAASSAPLSSGR